MKKRLPWWLLPVAFVLVPLIEIFVIVKIGQVIGAWWTIALLVIDSAIGAWLVKREGGRAWRALRTALEERRMPAGELADGVLILVGGTLMLTPGFVTDLFGVLCILPVTRPVGRRLLSGFIARRLLPGSGPVGAYGETGRARPGRTQPGQARQGQARQGQARQGPGPGDDVVRGEVID